MSKIILIMFFLYDFIEFVVDLILFLKHVKHLHD